jgi:hypothetical protein
MSGNTKEWIAVALFFVCFAGLTLAEVMWLGWRKWATFGKAAAFSILTNVVGFCFGLFISFVILSVVIALSWDGSIDQIPAHDVSLWTAVIVAVFITPVLLLLSKRILLWLLKIRSGLAAWGFAFLTSILIFSLTLGLPVAFLYFV